MVTLKHVRALRSYCAKKAKRQETFETTKTRHSKHLNPNASVVKNYMRVAKTKLNGAGSLYFAKQRKDGKNQSLWVKLFKKIGAC